MEYRKQMNCILLSTAVLLILIVVSPAAAGDWSWQVEIADPEPGTGAWTSIAVDRGGYPRIAYGDSLDFSLHYAWKDSVGSWRNETADSTEYTWNFKSLEISPVDHTPVITYWNGTHNRLMYGERDPATGWSVTPLDAGGFYNSLAIDPAGRPHVSYSGTDFLLYYAYRDTAGWHFQTVDDSGDGRSCSIALDPHGKPAIAYYDSLNRRLRFAGTECTPAHPPIPEICMFVPETVETGVNQGSDVSLAIDASGNPSLSYIDENNILHYAIKKDDRWYKKRVDTTGSGSYGASLALNDYGIPAISYYAGGDLRFAWELSPGIWHIMTVDGKDAVGDWSSLAFDRNGNAHISYHDATHAVLKYAQGTPVRTFPGCMNPPADPDGDGIFEDINGNGRLDFADIVLYFSQMEWIAENEPIKAFDLNDNNRIDFADIVALFNEI